MERLLATGGLNDQSFGAPAGLAQIVHSGERASALLYRLAGEHFCLDTVHDEEIDAIEEILQTLAARGLR